MSIPKVGDIEYGIPSTSHPHLTAVGDEGWLLDKETDKPIGRYRVIKIYTNPVTGETLKYDAEIIEVFTDDATA